MTQRIEPSFEKFDFQELNLLKNMTQRIWTFFQYAFFLVRHTELNLFFENDTQNWTIFLNMTPIIEPFFSVWLKELNIFQYAFF